MRNEERRQEASLLVQGGWASINVKTLFMRNSLLKLVIVPWNSADLPAVKPQQLIRTFGTHVFLSPSVPCLWLIAIFYWSVLPCLIHVSVVVININLGQLFPLFLSIFGHYLFLLSVTRDNVEVLLLDQSIFHSIDNKNTLFVKSMRPLSQQNINGGRLTTKMRSLCQMMLN